MRIELSGPDITQQEIDAVAGVLRSGRLSLGPKVPEFEQAFARYIGVKHAVAVSSGTCALHLLMRAVGLEPGDEVITTPFSFISSANCIVFERGRPVLVDIDPHTWNIDIARIEDVIRPSKTKAIIPVDVFGLVPDMDAISEIATRHGLWVIEDSCEALGSKYKGRMAGSLGDAGCFGFYPNKQITTGEGGMITTDDDEFAHLCGSMRNQGRDTMAWLSHQRLGYNYRLTDIACAIGLAQLQRIPEILAKRRQVADWYRQRLAGDERIEMQKLSDDCEMSWFVFVVKLADRYTEQDRADIIEKLRAKGIGCSNYFAPIHLQDFYRRDFGYEQGDFPVCERVAARTIALPFHNALTESEVDEVGETLRLLL